VCDFPKNELVVESDYVAFLNFVKGGTNCERERLCESRELAESKRASRTLRNIIESIENSLHRLVEMPA
jgi:hypothetical protein